MLPKPRSKFLPTIYALIACLTIFPCEAAGPLIRPTETGQVRELINQPICWTNEKADGWHVCELADQ